MMNQPHLKILSVGDTEHFFQLVEKNKTQLALYFPETVKQNKSLKKTKNYVQTMLRAHGEREYFPFGIFQNDQLIGLIQIKNFDWEVPK